MDQRIGPYVVDGRLGVGGMGIVYAAHDEALHRRVALKVISPQLAHDEEFRARFVREARAMASLDSPHVVSVFAHGETDGQLWMATQLFPDGDLGTLLRRSGPPPLLDGIELMAQVADGLAAAHDAGLVHRDIKPANVLLRRTGTTWTAALADFGIARAGTDQTGLTQGGMVGTPSYMAPELHRGAEAGPASDVYSMGCLVWTTLTGTAPFGGTTDYEVVTAHLSQPVPHLDGPGAVVAAVDRVLQRAMAKDPARRHGSAAELRDELRAAARATTDPRETVRLPAPAAAPSRGPRREVVIGLAVVAVLVAAAGLTWALLPDREVARVSSPTATAPTSVTESPSSGAPSSGTPDPSSPTLTPPSPPEPPAGYDRAVRRLATESFAVELEKDPTIGSEHAVCIAREALRGTGLEKMTDAGFFDDSWSYVDQDLESHEDIKLLLATATFSCIAG